MRLRDLLQRTGLTQDEVELYFGSLSILILGMIVVWLRDGEDHFAVPRFQLTRCCGGGAEYSRSKGD